MGVPLAAEPTAEKLRGGYYTPKDVARWLTRWAVRSRSDKVLEPSAGDGVFIEAARELTDDHNITAVEQDPGEASKIRRLWRNARVVASDVFGWWRRSRNERGSYDAVIGNPPFIRYQHFPEEHRASAFEVMRAEGLSPTRLTNAWVPFVVLATVALKPGGRLAMVLPAELMQVTYASELRQYLTNNYSELTLITFEKLIFDGILQETVLLLGVRSDGRDESRIRTLALRDADDLARLDMALAGSEALALDHSREKWTQYFLTQRELDFLRDCEANGEFVRLGDLAEVDVGVVTGRNQFFVMTGTEAESLGLVGDCSRLVGRAAHVPGLLLSDADWDGLEATDARCYLLDLGPVDRDDLSPEALAYIKAGEAAKAHTGYKCRIRMPRWWNLPSSWAPDAFLLRQIYDGPRIIRNEAGATATDTLHRVSVKPGVDADDLAAVSVNSLTWAFAEIRGRSYGGGVLELEPTEAESLPVPKRRTGVPLGVVDAIVRTHGTDAALDEVDRLVLKEAGLTKHDIGTLRGIWAKMAARRGLRGRG